MKRPLTIISAVAAYSLFETVLLLSLDVPQQRFSPSLYQKVVVLAQFLTIPGIAALMSRIAYGPLQWLRRTLTILVGGVLVAPAAIFSFVIVIIPLAWASESGHWTFAILSPVVLILEIWGLLLLMRKSGIFGAQIEAERWLAERQAGMTPSVLRARARSIRFAVCIPCMIVLAVFLFLPEVWGMLSHFGHLRHGKLSGYRVTVPATSIILNTDEESNGWSSITGLFGKGIARGVNPFRYDSLSSWSVVTVPYGQAEMTDYDRWMPPEEEIVDRRVLMVGSEKVTCLEYWPAYDFGPGRLESATIKCMGSGRLQATFDGNKPERARFYQMVSGIRQER